MSLNDLQKHLFAFYVAGAAQDLTIAGRFYPYGDLILIIEDKIQIAARKFGFKVKSQAKPVATAFLDLMIERGGFSSVKQEIGGTMHQFQGDAYKKALKDLQDSDEIVAKAKAAGDENFWKETFEQLTSS